MKLGVDFDGVIAKVEKKYADFAEGIDEQGMRALTEAVLFSDQWKEYTLDMPPMEGLEYFTNLIREHEVFIVSRRLETDRKTLLTWLRQNNLKLPANRIYLRKNLDISPIEHKKQACIILELDLLIDDSVKVVEAIPVARLFKGWELRTNYDER